jgi:hypothetical protein
MDKDSILDEIFANDPFGLLKIKPATNPARNADEKLVASFMEIVDFYEQHNREPQHSGDMKERMLCSRLNGIRENDLKVEMLREYDKFMLLNDRPKEINSFEDIFNDDTFGLLENEVADSLFDLKHVKPIDKDRAETDFVAQRKACKDFHNYEPLFKTVHDDIKNGIRKCIEFKLENLRQDSFYIHNGILFYVEKIEITIKDHYKVDGTRVREDGRTRCIFENGTESNMLKRSIEKMLYSNGQVVTENVNQTNLNFLNKFNNITSEDKQTGFIYVLKSKSEKKEINEITNLFKIGFSSTTVEERIKNAIKEPTYLMSDVDIITTFECYNMNPQKLELLLHNVFGKVCLNVDVFDLEGNRHTPREWFVAPLNVIEDAIKFIISGEIIKYKYDELNEKLMLR